ncbi:MAG: choline/ethanolamine kinase family protein [Lachnospiraceae bacterium]|nr:choline/ethanolamine kinase family protein [Lachnospiraceae bacterium]
MADIQTTGGVLTDEIREHILENITRVFYCQEVDINDLEPVQAGLTNIVLSFRYNGGKYIYRHPGLGSDALVDRGRETIMQKVVEDIGIDTTLVAMDVDEGWKISRFIEHRDFDYHNLNDMVRAIMLLRKLHEAPARVRWNFDVIKKAEEIKAQIPEEDYGNFDDFDQIRDNCYKLYQLAKHDGIRHCNVHGDARDVNFLINKEEIYLIDWEYGGYGDPGFDLGSYICGGRHSLEEIDRILFTYYRRKPTPVQKRHFYAYIALTGWFYLHWVMLKESKGQKIGYLKDNWYHYAKVIGELALKMYKDQGVKED